MRTDLLAYDINSGKWKKLQIKGQQPKARDGHTATLVSNEKMLLLGGMSKSWDVLKEVWSLDLTH